MTKKRPTRRPVLAEIPECFHYPAEERGRLRLVDAKERRAELRKRPILCEVCSVRLAMNFVDKSLVACCNNRADRCPGPLSESAVCHECGSSAKRITKSGPVCGEEKHTGCPSLLKRASREGTAKRQILYADPATLSSIKSKYRATLQERYGVTGVCRLESWKTSMVARYGVDNPSQSKEIQEGRAERTRARYGVEHTSQLPSTKKAFADTCKQRYGVRNVSMSKELRKAWEEKHTKQYGVHHPMCRPEVQDLQKQAFRVRYGHPHAMQHPAVRAKAQGTLQKRYGTTSPSKVPGAMETRRQNCLVKYGVDHPSQDPKTFREKFLPAFYKNKTLVLPSGNSVIYQGYEDRSLRYLLSTYAEHELLFNGEVSLRYEKPSGSMGTYYPDIVVPGPRRLIEVKSTYTLKKGLQDGSIAGKLKAAGLAGWEPELHLYEVEQEIPTIVGLEEVLALAAAD